MNYRSANAETQLTFQRYKSSKILRNWDFAVFCIYNSLYEKRKCLIIRLFFLKTI